MTTGSDAYSATGFSRFLDQLLLHGLERFGLFYGQYRGYVVDNEDENDMGRLVVRCPAVGDTPETRRIAYPKAPAGGRRGDDPPFGFRFIPPVDSVVWLTFEGGKLDSPIWEGSWFLRDKVPEVWQGNVQAGGLITPAGHEVFFFDDKDDQQVLRIKHLNGALIEFDNDGNITIANVDGKLVNVGLEADEAAVGGDTLKSIMEELIDAILQLTVPTGTGPSGTPINAASFQSVKQKLEQFLSQTVKVKK